MKSNNLSTEKININLREDKFDLQLLFLKIIIYFLASLIVSLFDCSFTFYFFLKKLTNSLYPPSAAAFIPLLK